MTKYANALITILFVLILAMLLAGIFVYRTIVSQGELIASLQDEVASYRTESLDALGMIDAQTIALQAELSTTQETASEQIISLQNTLEAQAALPKDTVITSVDLAPFLTGVVQVICDDEDGTTSSGSGSLWKFRDVPHAVLTNRHVVDDAVKCLVHITNASNDTVGIFELNTSNYKEKPSTDTAVLGIGRPLNDSTLAAWTYNFALSDMRTCPSNLPAGTPVVMIGFPAYAKRNVKIDLPEIGEVSSVYRAVTNGIISGFDTALLKPAGSLEYHNFFVSAKIDSGNSGGMALAKDDKGLCTLGLPTWLTLGNYETQGLVQNILNVLD